MSFFGTISSNNNNTDSKSTITETFISTANQKVFTLKNPYSMGKNKVQVYISGVPQFSPINFTETNNTTITLSEPITSGLTVVVVYEVIDGLI